MDKRGISPLIAAILLVAFAVTLAALVSTYVINKAKEFHPEEIAEESLLCESVSLGYTADAAISIDAIPGDTSGLQLIGPITLINRGAFSIHQLIITAPGQVSQPYPVWDTSVSPARAIALEPGANNKYNISIGLNSDLEDKTIKIVPVVNDTEKVQLVRCTDRQVVIDYTQLCLDVGLTNTCETP